MFPRRISARRFIGICSVSKPDALNLWEKTCQYLKDLLHPDVYSRWIEVIQPVSLEDTQLTLAVENDFYQTWLEENYLPLIKDAIRTASGNELTIVFSIREKKDEPVKEKEPPAKKTLRARFTKKKKEPLGLNPRFTFDGFVIGSSNNFAHAASLAVAQAPARAYNPLFIYGGVGLGKTHLMQAIGHHVSSSSRAEVVYLSSEALLNEYIDALQNRGLIQFRKKYRQADLLLIDDIHFLAGKERIQEEFFHTFNALFDAHRQIVMTSDRPASEITGLEHRLVSRFEWGLVTELEPPDLETRIAILRNKQAQAEINLPDNLISFIAENIKSNVRRLEGAFVRAVSYASLTGRELTEDSLRYLLRDTLEQEEHLQISLEAIQKAVAEHYDVRLADMSSKRRPRAVAMPRQVAMYLCRRMTRSSLPDIASAFSKTHATVLHAYRSIDSRMDVDSDLRREVSHISRKLGQPVA